MIGAVLLGALNVAGFVPAQESPRVARAEVVLPGTVLGRVLTAETGQPIEGASLEVRSVASLPRYVVTDSTGTYRIAGIDPGRVVVIARALDRSPLRSSVQLASGATVPLDFSLERRPVLLPALFAAIDARRLAGSGLTRGGYRDEGETELRALEASPGAAELGLTGGSGPDPNDPANVLYVRGAASDLKLVLIDEAPVYAPFHLSGLLDAFPDGVLERARLYIGGTPARYDGGLSYVLDLDVRQGDAERIHTAGSVDLLGVTGRVEGPLWNGSRVLLSGRALHGAGYPAVTGESDLPYGYGDLLGRFDTEIFGGELSATGFWNRESIVLDIGKLEEAGADEAAYWGNVAGSVRYALPVGDGTLTLVGANGLFTTQLPVPIEDTETETLIPFATARGQTARARTEAFYESGERRVRWAAGAGFDTHETVLEQETVLGDTTSLASGRAHVVAAWGETTWRIAPEVELSGGLRADYFDPADEARLAPRASLTWHVTDAADLKLSGGRFFQLVRGPESILSGDLTGPTIGGPELDTAQEGSTAPFLEVAGATHLVVGLDNRLENGLELGIEGYFKSFDGLPEAQNLYSSGADLWVQATRGPVRGWVGYSLAWVWADDADRDRRFVGRQLLSGGLSTDYRGFDLGVRVAYGAGLPFQSVSGSETGADAGENVPAPSLAGAPDDSYLRIDAEVSRDLITTVGSTSLRLSPYLRVLNALDRRDALFYQAAGEDGPPRPAPLASVPFVAILGMAWAF